MRLRGPEAFSRVFDAASGTAPTSAAGRVSSGPFQAVFLVRPVATGRPGPMRLGLAVPRRLGTAVVRNRLRRQLREAFRTLGELHTPGVDVVVLARPHKPLETPVVRQHVRRVLERLARCVRGDVCHPPPDPSASPGRT